MVGSIGLHIGCNGLLQCVNGLLLDDLVEHVVWRGRCGEVQFNVNLIPLIYYLWGGRYIEHLKEEWVSNDLLMSNLL